MHTLYLSAVDLTKPASIMRGLRDALRALDYDRDDMDAMIAKALAVAKAGELPLGIAELEDYSRIAEAAEALWDGSHGACQAGIDLTEAEAAEHHKRAKAAAADAPQSGTLPKGGDASFITYLDDAPTLEAAQTALFLLALAEGNFAAAYANARVLARTTGDETLYAEVCRLIVTAFNVEITDGV